MMNDQKNQKRRPSVNEKCIGCGACISICNEVFEFDKDGMSKAKRLDDYEGKGVDDAIACCPVNAIHWIAMRSEPMDGEENTLPTTPVH